MTTTQACSSYTVQSGDNLTNIGKWFGYTVQELAKHNQIPNPDMIQIGQKINFFAKKGQEIKHYEVKSGDTLSEIAEKNHLKAARPGKKSWEDLAHYNHIPNPNVIQAGQRICIPVKVPAFA
ncbi:putative chitinase [Saccharopolyspora erythraea NRRL 2338]|uniref:LysM domain-containing protein n=1 Tax=Saccharopolyspora erythraea TaxID=1836 RepID=A0ABN1DPZ8_SACER|nr:LysM domain-containing protein [Saccharopolyspora erythraea]PFG97924.1 putative chitinase [Saccharopolyspora erythraea NRRL 2338]